MWKNFADSTHLIINVRDRHRKNYTFDCNLVLENQLLDGTGILDFADQTASSDNRFSGITISNGQQLSLIDIDNDGSLELFVTSNTFPPTISFYEYDPDTKQYSLSTDNPLGDVSLAKNSAEISLAFGDWDGDEDFDVFIVDNSAFTNQGEEEFRYYENVGIKSQPIFEARTEVDNPLYDSNTGAVFVESDGGALFPVIVDLNDDGLADLLFSEEIGAGVIDSDLVIADGTEITFTSDSVVVTAFVNSASGVTFSNTTSEVLVPITLESGSDGTDITTDTMGIVQDFSIDGTTYSNDVTLTVDDNDTAGITITPPNTITTSESDTIPDTHVTSAPIEFVLDTEPTESVFVYVGVNDSDEALLSETDASGNTTDANGNDIGEIEDSVVQLSFTPDNWDVSQYVALTGINDAIDDGDIDYNLTVAAVSEDPLYNDDTVALALGSTFDADTDTTISCRSSRG